jgi:hypothetical protein
VAVWDRRRILAYLAETYGGAAPAGGGWRAMPAYMGGVCAVEGGCDDGERSATGGGAD